MVLGALGVVGVVISMFVPWRDGGVYLSDVPVSYLWDRAASSGPSLLILLIPLALVLAIGTFVPRGTGVRLVGAVGTLIVAGLFAYQVHRVVDAFGGDLGDALDTGFYLAAIGGIVAFVSGFFPTLWRTRREVVRPGVVDDGSFGHE